MIDEIKKDTASRMAKSIDSLRLDFAKIRTGRAHTSLLDHIKVPYYGSDVSLSQVANVTVAESRMLTVTPWEKDMVPIVEKAIMSSDLGLNPSTSGTVIRVVLPQLTEDRRREMTKVVRNEAESARVAVRNIRRDANGDFKELLKEKEITEDEARNAEDDTQKLTDKYVNEVEKMLTEKESELMEI